MHTISSYHGNRPTNTDRTDYNTLSCSFASVQCNKASKSSIKYVIGNPAKICKCRLEPVE